MGDHYTTRGIPKRRWDTRAQAKRALRIQRAQGIDNEGQQPYRCEQCGGFHLGHYPVDPAARAGKRARHHRAAYPEPS